MTFRLPVAAAGIAACAAAAAHAGTPFSDELPALEIQIDAALPAVDAQDRRPRAVGNAAGEVCVLAREGFALRSLYSSNGGASFAAEVDVAPGIDVQTFAVDLGADGTVYAALVVVDPLGGLGLAETHSTDMGQSWSTPQTLVANGDGEHNLELPIAVDANSSGLAAIVFAGNDGLDAYAVASGNGGSTWTGPVRVDAGAAAHAFAVTSVDVVVDEGGTLGETIHVAFRQSRGSGLEIWYTRSTDSGATYAAEIGMTSLSGATQHDNPQLAPAADGSLLLAAWGDDGTDGKSYVLRSTDQGTSWGTSHNLTIQSRTDPPFAPSLTPSSDDAEVLLALSTSSDELQAYRSTDHGASFGFEDSFANVQNFSAARTPSNVFVVAWTEARSDGYAEFLTDVFAAESTACCTWNTEQRVDGDAAGAARTVVGQIAAEGNDGVFFPMQDGRAAGSRAFDVWGNNASASSMSFGADYRIDSDAGQESPPSFDHPAIAGDGASRVYVALPAVGTGPHPDLYVATSSDGGYTFGAPVRVGSTAAGTTIDWRPVLAATSDGFVYLVYESDVADGSGREIRFNRSNDFGATWLASDVVLMKLAGHPSGYGTFGDYPAPSVAALPGGTVYVAWSDGMTVFLADSSDGGSSFDTNDVDQSGSGFERYPRVCAQGNQVVLVWRGADLAVSNFSVWGTVSDDNAASWSARTQLRPEAVGGGADLPTLACDGAGGAVAAWPDFRGSGIARMRASRYDGTGWLGDTPVNGPAGPDQLDAHVVFVNDSDALLVYGNDFGRVYVNRSTDGGNSFTSPQLQLDGAAPEADLASFGPRIVTDGSGTVSGTGNAWAAWLDASAGQLSLVARHSADGGTSFGPVTRIDSIDPDGAYLNTYGSTAAFGALPGAALFSWAGERESAFFSVLASAWDLDDLDRDQVDSSVDCDDQDPNAGADPAPIDDLELEKIVGGVRLSWTAGAGGSVYDIAGGGLADLRADADFSGASCLQDDHGSASYDDNRPDPTSGDGYWYLVRIVDAACGPSSWGDSSLAPDPRDDLDTASPCP